MKKNEHLVKVRKNNKFRLTGLTRRNFYIHIAVNYLVLMLVLIIVLTSYLFVTKASLLENVDVGLIKKASELSVEAPFTYEERDNKSNRMDRYGVVYFDAGGNRAEKYGNIPPQQNFDKGGVLLDEIREFKKNSVRYRAYMVSVNCGDVKFKGWTVRVITSVEEETNIISHLGKITGIYSVAMAILMLLVSALLAIVQVRPYNNAIVNSQSFTSNASHEINTPLTIIKANLQNMMSEPEARIEEVSKSIAISLSELDRLQKLTKQLLVLSRSEDNRLKLTYELTDLKGLVEEILEPYILIAEEQDKEVHLIFNGDFSEPLCLDGSSIKQILVALMDNEIKYTKPFNDIWVKCENHVDGRVSISVEDNGDGVDEIELDKIFMRFYRSDKSRNSPGTGLGLSIVHALVKAMDGMLIATSIKPHGLRIKIILPVQKRSRN